MHARRLRDAFPADLTTHPPPKTFARPRSATHPPEHFCSPTQPRRTPRRPHNPSPVEAFARPRTATRPPRALPLPHPAPTLARRLRDAFPAEGLCPPTHSDTPSPSTSAPPRSPDARPQAARCIPRGPHNPFPAAPPCSPSVPLRAQKNGTAQWMCDAECLGRPSLRSVIVVGEPRAVRRRCGALAWRVGLRPQPWALRSRRCGRVLRA